jgi:hypothetical protein
MLEIIAPDAEKGILASLHQALDVGNERKRHILDLERRADLLGKRDEFVERGEEISVALADPTTTPGTSRAPASCTICRNRSSV